MSAFLDALTRRAALSDGTIALPEGEDPRVVAAASQLVERRWAKVALWGEADAVRAAARKSGATATGLDVRSPRDPSLAARTETALRAARGNKITADEAKALAQTPLMQAALLVREGEASAFVAGAAHPTSDVLRAAIFLVGVAPGVRTVSSYFAMLKEDAAGKERVLFFADGGVVPDPDPAQLADIGIATADNFKALTGHEPHVAFLSFSTRGSAQHPHVDKVRAAVAHARARRPDLHLDGEMQADAALVESVAKVKAPGSIVAGHANVLVFPDLDAANIGYKLVQRLGGWTALGPILQGLAKPANDLSRGCSSEDVVRVSLFALAGARKDAA